jgi:hypothetical protein
VLKDPADLGWVQLGIDGDSREAAPPSSEERFEVARVVLRNHCNAFTSCKSVRLKRAGEGSGALRELAVIRSDLRAVSNGRQVGVTPSRSFEPHSEIHNANVVTIGGSAASFIPL